MGPGDPFGAPSPKRTPRSSEQTTRPQKSVYEPNVSTSGSEADTWQDVRGDDTRANTVQERFTLGLVPLGALLGVALGVVHITAGLWDSLVVLLWGALGAGGEAGEEGGSVGGGRGCGGHPLNNFYGLFVRSNRL